MSLKAMKVILTGCTGFIGSEVLTQCLRNPDIISVIALTRRKLPAASSQNTKLETIVMEDFNIYPDSVLEKLGGADACIWCMGTTAGDKVLEIDYPLAFSNAFSRESSERQKKFRYLHLSGAVTERDQNKSLWFKGEMRKMKRAAEQNMLNFSEKEDTKGLWQTLIVRAGLVITKDGISPRDMMGWMMGISKSIRVNELAAAMIDLALNSHEQGTIQDSEVMVKKGREVLIKMKS